MFSFATRWRLRVHPERTLANFSPRTRVAVSGCSISIFLRLTSKEAQDGHYLPSDSRHPFVSSARSLRTHMIEVFFLEGGLVDDVGSTCLAN